MEKSVQPRGAPVYPLDTQGEFSVIAGPDGHRSVLFRLRSRNPSLEFQSLDNDSAWGISRCKTHYLHGAVYAIWVRCSPGTLEDTLRLRGVSIRVPPTTLSAIGLALSQQPVRGSQPRDPPIRLFPQGPFTMSHAVCLPFLQPQGTGHTPAPASLPSPSFPTPKELVGPTALSRICAPLVVLLCPIPLHLPQPGVTTRAKRSVKGSQRNAGASWDRRPS